MGTKLGVGPGVELATQSLPGCMMVATGGVASHAGPTRRHSLGGWSEHRPDKEL